MQQYLALMQDIRDNGNAKGDRTGTGTLSVFGRQMRFDLSQGFFPLVTTKHCHLKSIIHELLWFLQGDTNIRYLKENGVRIWDNWVLEGTAEYRAMTDEEIVMEISTFYKCPAKFWHRTEVMRDGAKGFEYTMYNETPADGIGVPCVPGTTLEELYEETFNRPAKKLVAGELGPVYGSQWRSWPNPQVTLIEDQEEKARYLESGLTYVDWLESGLNLANVTNDSIDQIKNVVEQLKTNPDSRRLIVSAWNPAQVDDMALPPCHCLFQFYTRHRPWEDVLTDLIDANLIDEFEEMSTAMRSNDQETPEWTKASGNAGGWRHPDYYKLCFEFAEKNGLQTRYLDCQLYQRSCDFFLGGPFNIASYSLLVMMIAQCVNMLPGEFVHTIGDAHLYSNHLEQVELQLSRAPKRLPRMLINQDVKDIFSFKFEDFELVGYEAHPHIAAPIAV